MRVGLCCGQRSLDTRAQLPGAGKPQGRRRAGWAPAELGDRRAQWKITPLFSPQRGGYFFLVTLSQMFWGYMQSPCGPGPLLSTGGHR